jgi:hypothetical protein
MPDRVDALVQENQQTPRATIEEKTLLHPQP